MPYGRCNDAALNRLNELGFKVIQWNSVGLEMHLASQGECEAFAKQLMNGSIVLLHGNNVPKYTLTFLQKIVPLLQKKGVSFVTVSDLLKTGSPTIVQEGYFVKPGDNLNLDTQFGHMGTGIRK